MLIFGQAPSTSFTLFISSSSLRIDVSKPPPDKSYGYDGLDYLKIFYLMETGQNYYQAYATAVIADKRVPTADSWLNNPILVRQPWLFYFWTLAANNGQLLVIIVIILAIIATGTFVAVVSSTYSSAAASISLLLLIPYLFMASVWANVFLPDWWAALIILLAVTAMLSKKYKLSAFLAFLAGICRESMIFLTLPAMIVSLYKREFKIALYYGISSFMIFLAFAVHYILAEKLLPPNQIAAAGRFVFVFNISSLITATSYLMFPYGFFKIPSLVFVTLAFIACIRLKDRLAGLTLALFILAFIGYAVFVNASSYWGQQFMIVVIGILPMTYFTGHQQIES